MLRHRLDFFVSAGVKDQSTAMILTPIILIPLMVFGGFFIQTNSIPVFLDWMKYLSPYYYAFPVLLSNELSGLTFDCTPVQGGRPVNVTVCPFVTGESYLNYLGFGTVNILQNFAILAALIVGYRCLSLIIFLMFANKRR